MLPSVAAALGYWPDGAAEQPARGAGERVDDIANAAVRAAEVAGTEVSGTDINGAQRGPRGRWAVLLRRRRATVSTQDVPGPDDHVDGEGDVADVTDGAAAGAPAAAPESRTGPDGDREREHASGTTVAGATVRRE
jgi:hypothetical protein